VAGPARRAAFAARTGVCDGYARLMVAAAIRCCPRAPAGSASCSNSPRDRRSPSTLAAVEIVLDNAYGARLLADVTRDRSKTSEKECTIAARGATKITVPCEVESGQYEVRLFGQAAAASTSRYEYVGTILVNSR
jgi:hypothetical protein